MAEQTSPDYFSCPLCTELLRDPVAIPCGHSFCMDCISGYWNEADYTGIYTCPQCRITFTQRPVLRPNATLTKVAEKIKKTGLNFMPPSNGSYAGPSDVPCDFCIGKKLKAVKSCLNCLASYCEKHLKPHYESTTFKRHKLVDELGNLDRKICPQHQKSLELFCRTDQMCICALCTVSEHKGHDIVSAEAERGEKQKLLGVSQAEIKQKCQQRTKELEELKTAVDSLKSSAQRAMAESKKMFDEMIASIERMRSEVNKLININERAAFSQAEGLMERLEQEIDELKKKETGLKQLYSTEDHIHFLQNFHYLCTPTDDGFIPRVSLNPDFSFSAARKAVAEIKERLEELGRDELRKISKSVNDVPVYTVENRTKEKTNRVKEVHTVDSSPPAEPRSRSEFLKYYCQLRLDPQTAHKELYISEGNRKVIRTRDPQPYSDNQDRFDSFAQVLCREALSGGRFYWEIEWSGEFSIGVACRGISRKGKGSLCLLGYNDKSWSLLCSDTGYSAWHNRVDKAVSGPHSSRIGVFLDHSAGLLAFYSIGETMTRLHRFETTFTEPLYPGFGVGTSVKICQLK
ncbi:tripartite motif-containing protein 16-like isoform X2 [Sinocyclocheilus anshuiensis]|uniref:Tripartite motif-containing protein 16-like n=1 Tax=Sinocyclocheilus anshuiensis TaxID=1608454 RepID=A0A671QR02_9TELE|nr:PREDICTED: tripartite motif-containing protein 16-like isoform X1 [Sinocyclocheilus anshuiensis]XP_016327809.1 PREDICTED: tripartite motif-containing protein 16-like isoform X2 [Sinocyclocheilus anshuiensis]